MTINAQDLELNLKDQVKSKREKLKSQYSLSGFDNATKIAQFRVAGENTGDKQSLYYINLPEFSSKAAVNDWLNKEGEESGLVDVDLKYKLLQKAKEWQRVQSGYEADHPKVTLETANANERYNLTVLTEQEKLARTFEQPHK